MEWIYSHSPDDSPNDKRVEEPARKGTNATPVWYVKVMVDGEFHGRGRGNTKKAARNEAAKTGLKMMGIFVWYVS